MAVGKTGTFLLLLTVILQSFRGITAARLVIHYDEDGDNHSIYFNGDLKDIFPYDNGDYYDENSTFAYDDNSSTLDYTQFITIVKKDFGNSGAAFHPCHCFLFFVTALHILHILLQYLRVPL